MLYSEAYPYVARALSRGTDTERTDAAKDAIKAAIEEWNLRRAWNFLGMDTRNGFTVASCTYAAGPPKTLTTTVANGFAGVNIGQTVTDSAGTPATANVTAITSTTVIQIDATLTTGTMTFSADIPVISGTDLYNLPTAIRTVYSARLQTNNTTLKFISMRENDRRFPYQTSTTNNIPIYYNNFNDATFSTAKQYGRIRLLPVPGVNDTLRVRYHRLITQPSLDADEIDLPSHYTYAMLTLARYYFLVGYNAENVRTGEMKERAEFLFKRAVLDDKMVTMDRDTRMVPFNEWGGSVLYHGEEDLEMPS